MVGVRDSVNRLGAPNGTQLAIVSANPAIITVSFLIDSFLEDTSHINYTRLDLTLYFNRQPRVDKSYYQWTYINNSGILDAVSTPHFGEC